MRPADRTRAGSRFHIGDAGPGIAPEVAQRLFTPFFTTRTEGMGLGLSLCRTVIEQHGGALDFGPLARVAAAPSSASPCRRPGPPAKARPHAAIVGHRP